MINKLKGTTKAGDDEITRNLVGLARTRPDIFGTRLALHLGRGWAWVVGAVSKEMERALSLAHTS